MKSSLLKLANNIPVYTTGRLILFVFVIVFYIKNRLYADVNAHNNIKVIGKAITPTVKKSGTKSKTSGANSIASIERPLNTFPLSYPRSPVTVVAGFSITPITPMGNAVPTPAYSNNIVVVPIATNSIVPTGIAIDAAGNIYVADVANSLIKKILASDSSTVFIGVGLNHPSGVAVDAAGNLYVSDTSNKVVKKITPGSSFLLY